MTTAQLARETELIKLLNDHTRQYYICNTPTVTDKEFDDLLAELKGLEKVAGRTLPSSPTQRVGSDLSGGFSKVKHVRPMLSLDNVFSGDELIAFNSGAMANCLVAGEPKIDGLSLSLHYLSGVLIQALTRGDGTLGEDVTANAKTIRTVPLLIPGFNGEVRGEVYMRRSVFAALNVARTLQGEDAFANPRNAASGSMKQRSPAEVANRRLDFMAYYVEDFKSDHTGCSCNLDSHVARLNHLLKVGFQTPLSVPTLTGTPVNLVFCVTGKADLQAAADGIEQHRATLDMDIDGAVFKIDSVATQQELGLKSKSPRWACAYKFKPEQVTTVLDDIQITVGRTGQVTPNARLKPVSLGGVTVSNASLMNADELERIGNPGIGDTVLVERSAEVIPRVVGVHTRRAARPWAFPKLCPFCHTTLVREAGQVHYYDPNRACPEQVYARLRHATAKGALDWDGMGEAQIRELIQQGAVKTLSDMFALNLPPAAGSTPLLKPAAQKKFLAERERVKQAPLWRKLAALGIENVGRTSSKELAQKYHSLLSITAAPRPELEGLLGPVATDSLVTFIGENADEIERLDGYGFKLEEEGNTGPLSGKTFVITGTLITGTRDAVSARIEKAGGLVKGSVSKGTDYLVMGEAPGGNKVSGAKKHGTVILAEEDLCKLLGVPFEPAEAPGIDAADV